MIMKTGFFQVSNLVKVQVEQFGRAAILSVGATTRSGKQFLRIDITTTITFLGGRGI